MEENQIIQLDSDLQHISAIYVKAFAKVGFYFPYKCMVCYEIKPVFVNICDGCSIGHNYMCFDCSNQYYEYKRNCPICARYTQYNYVLERNKLSSYNQIVKNDSEFLFYEILYEKENSPYKVILEGSFNDDDFLSDFIFSLSISRFEHTFDVFIDLVNLIFEHKIDLVYDYTLKEHDISCINKYLMAKIICEKPDMITKNFFDKINYIETFLDILKMIYIIKEDKISSTSILSNNKIYLKGNLIYKNILFTMLNGIEFNEFPSFHESKLTKSEEHKMKQVIKFLHISPSKHFELYPNAVRIAEIICSNSKMKERKQRLYKLPNMEHTQTKTNNSSLLCCTTCTIM